MSRSRVQALFPKLDPGINATGDIELSFGWRRYGLFSRNWQTVGGSRTAKIVAAPFWTGFSDKHATHKLHLGSDQVVPIHRKIPSFDSDVVATVGPGADWTMRLQRHFGKGSLSLMDGRRMTLIQKGSRASLRHDHKVVAQHAPAWRDKDAARQIRVRTGVVGEFTWEEAMMISALLILTEPRPMEQERVPRRSWWWW